MAKAASNLSKFTSFMSEDDAIAMLERLRWPNGAACPFCGGADPYKLTPKATTKTRTQKGLWKCSQCRKKFTVGMSALQFSRMLGLTYRAAWFMAHRLRHAMSQEGFRLSGTIEVDETYVGGGKRRLGRYSYEGKGGRPGPKDPIKTPVVALVERNGRAIAFPVARVDGKTLQAEVRKRTIPSLSWMMSDEWQGYMGFRQGFVSHEHVNHGIPDDR